MGIPQRIETIGVEAALRTMLPDMVIAGRLAESLRSIMQGARHAGRMTSPDDAIQSWVTAKLLDHFNNTSFHAPKRLSTLCDEFPTDQPFVWMLDPTDTPHYWGKSNEYAVKLVLFDDRKRKHLGVIAVRPASNDALVVWNDGDKTGAFRVNTDPKREPLEYSVPPQIGRGEQYLITATRRPIVRIPESLQNAVKILKDAGLAVILDLSGEHPSSKHPPPTTGELIGSLSINTPAHGEAADGWMTRQLGGQWIHGDYDHNTRQFAWSIVAMNERVATLLRATLSAHELRSP